MFWFKSLVLDSYVCKGDSTNLKYTFLFGESSMALVTRVNSNIESQEEIPIDAGMGNNFG